MKWNDLARTAAKLGLPTLGGALAGPAGAVAGKAIADALGSDASPEAVAEALAADPDALVRLRQVEADMAAEQNRHEEQLAAIGVDDVQNARRVHGQHWMTWALPLILLALWTLVTLVGFFGYVVPEMKEQYYFALGALSTAAFTSGVGYWLGSSAGSAKRGDEISDMLRQRGQR